MILRILASTRRTTSVVEKIKSRFVLGGFIGKQEKIQEMQKPEVGCSPALASKGSGGDVGIGAGVQLQEFGCSSATCTLSSGNRQGEGDDDIELIQGDTELHLFGVHAENSRWADVFGSSRSIRSPSLYLALRLGLALLFQAELLFSLLGDEDRVSDGGSDYYDWLPYMSRWALAAQTAYVTLAAYTTFKASEVLNLRKAQVQSFLPVVGTTTITEESKENETRLPIFVRATWIILHLALPASLMVTLFYWSLLGNSPIFMLTRMPPSSYFVCIGAQGLNFLLLGLDLLLGKLKLHLQHIAAWLLGYVAVTCTAWAVVKKAEKICVEQGYEERAHITDDCPLYGAVGHQGFLPRAVVWVFLAGCAALLCERLFSSWSFYYRRTQQGAERHLFCRYTKTSLPSLAGGVGVEKAGTTRREQDQGRGIDAGEEQMVSWGMVGGFLRKTFSRMGGDHSLGGLLRSSRDLDEAVPGLMEGNV